MAEYFEDLQTDFNPDEDFLSQGTGYSGGQETPAYDFGGVSGPTGGWNITPELDFIGSLAGPGASYMDQYSPVLPSVPEAPGGFGAFMGNMGQGIKRYFEDPDTQKSLAKGGLGLMTSGLSALLKRSPSQPAPMAMAGYQSSTANAYQPAPYEAPPGTKASPLITKGPTRVVASQGLNLDDYRKKGGPSGGMTIGV